MSIGKIVLLVLYAVLAILAITQTGTSVGALAVWALLALAVVHAIEVLVFFRLSQRAPGSLAGNLLQVFLFGFLHAAEMKAQS
jgi:uncharacterized protein YhhL (DUF1145 family)